MAQGGAGDPAQHRSIEFFALPCSYQQQAGGLQATRRVHQGHLQGLAGQLAAGGELAEQAVGNVIDFCDATQNRVCIFKNIRDQGIGLQRGKGLCFQGDLHDSVIASGCDT